MAEHKTVILNKAYLQAGIKNIQSHIERNSQAYTNSGIMPSRSEMNVHFKAPESSYSEYISQLLDKGELSKYGLKRTSYIMDEFVMDVNSLYFEERGGYGYAKRFYEEGYKYAIKEAGDEKWIISAVMHADEIHKNLSIELGKSVFHYHMHVAYIPAVYSEIKYPINYKDQSLAGQVKESAYRISHSQKWPSRYETLENGAREKISEYARLQDRYFEHMSGAGFEGFERGERGSSQKHLSTLEFKTMKERELLNSLELKREELTRSVAKIEKDLYHAQSILESVEHAEASLSELKSFGKQNIFGNIVISPEDWNKAQEILMSSSALELAADSLAEKLAETTRQRDELSHEIGLLSKEHEKLREETLGYRQAASHDSQEIGRAIDKILEQAEQRREDRQRSLNKGEHERTR
ncbi:MAG: plasmid recombination protein [Eubacteriaceae bacterium]|jgi:hypothetical protein|nr:plasmid recombination protein [Eubacteriaceae bacterium]